MNVKISTIYVYTARATFEMSKVYMQQCKLTKTEWESIELPLQPQELDILHMIRDGFANPNICNNRAVSICSYLKLPHTQEMNVFLYSKYFSKIVKDMNVSFLSISADNNLSIKKADQIRLNRNQTDLSRHVFEYVLIEYISKCICAYNNYPADRVFVTTQSANVNSSKKNKRVKLPYPWSYYYYTLYILSKYSVHALNTSVMHNVNQTLDYYRPHVDLMQMVMQCVDLFEHNHDLLKYEDMRLYEHQKQIFSIAKLNGPKLILYAAPTGTGKTLTPIGLSEKYRIIFVCAARHVGLALARSAINIGKKTAFAFGCSSASDIRLHFYAAKNYSVNKRSGGIGKVDNSVGDNVEIMISDIQSYIYAMHYMRAFNSDDRLMVYWDEPTIAMDCVSHELHDTIRRNWIENAIPNLVLSSATLPQIQDIPDVMLAFMNLFPDASIETVTSCDCKKTIPLIRTDGYIAMPHMYEDYDIVLDAAHHCINTPALLRYLDLSEIVCVLSTIHSTFGNDALTDPNLFCRMFENVSDITMKNIKMYYLHTLTHIRRGLWGSIHVKWKMGFRSPAKHNYGAHITTHSAHTLHNGPTIFITSAIDKIASFCIQELQIPSYELSVLMNKITANNTTASNITHLEREVETIAEQSSKSDMNTNASSKNKSKSKSDKPIKDKTDNDKNPKICKLNAMIDTLKNDIQPMFLNSVHVPNKMQHINRWAGNETTSAVSDAFTSDICEEDVVSIMGLEVDDSWKLLLLLGIGVITEHGNIEYAEIMKRLSDEQRLYLIIADSDYIYGTNYQLCHGYIGKELDMTQDKIVQAIGRIGRSNVQSTYSVRFRNDAHIDLLFMPRSSDSKIEVINMNKLWG